MAVVAEFDYLCRLCATKTGLLMGLPIFEAGERMRNIDKKIAACLPLQVSMTDQLPKVVCEECAYKLDQLFDFREKCLRTEGLFREMLKEIGKEGVGMEAIRRNMQDMQNGGIVSSHEAAEGAMPAMHVMDEMDLAGGEQVVAQEEMGQQDADMEVAGIGCLDGDTVRMVDEHIREVSNHEIAMHLEGDMTVVGNLTVSGHLGQLGINYVTSIDPGGGQSREQIVHYCDTVKYEAVPIKQEYQRLQDRLTAAEGAAAAAAATAAATAAAATAAATASHAIVNNVSADEGYAPTETHGGETNGRESGGIEREEGQHGGAAVNPTNGINAGETAETIVEYTKRAKDALLESILNSPSVDESGSHWYVCPFCNEAAVETSNLAVHFERHFCGCPCGLYFTSVDALTLHEQRCDAYKSALSAGSEGKATNEEGSGTGTVTGPGGKGGGGSGGEETAKKQPSVRQKWTPKVCAQCGKQYRTNYKLQEHMRKHTGEKPFQCLMCEKAFRSKIGLAQHTATHTGQFDYNCSTCGKGFQCKSYLIVHQRVHSDLKPYPCNTCGQNFKTKQSLLDHENRHLGVKPYMCEICGRGFITKGLCKTHQKIHSGMDNRQYPCVVCNKMFVSKSYLNTHLRIHTGEKPYLCEVCGKGFLTRVDLKIHSTMHTGEKSFKCEICGKVFARRAALRCHRRSHTGERPYRCDVCGKTFTQFSPMAIHKRLHTGERPYECDVCGKAFVSRSTMMCHRKKHHISAPAPAPASASASTPTTAQAPPSNSTQADTENGVKDILPTEIVLRESHEGLQITAD